MKERVKYDVEILVLNDHTSEEDDRKRRKEQVIQQDKRVLVQVGGVETDDMELVFADQGALDTHLLNGKNQNMANTQMTFYPAHQHTGMSIMSAEHTL